MRVTAAPQPLPLKTIESFQNMSELKDVTLGSVTFAHGADGPRSTSRLFVSTVDAKSPPVPNETFTEAVLRAATVSNQSDFGEAVLTGVLQAADGAYHVAFLNGTPGSWSATGAEETLSDGTRASAFEVTQASSPLKAVVAMNQWFNLSGQSINVDLPAIAPIRHS